ncbi:MAG: hypothetical protein P1U36_01890 [Legionellaceae bacterium]|nr:hypothetical protein [Legionellaceae bacterium]
MPTLKNITHKLTTQYKSAQLCWLHDESTDKQTGSKPECTYLNRQYDILLPHVISPNSANEILNLIKKCIEKKHDEDLKIDDLSEKWEHFEILRFTCPRLSKKVISNITLSTLNDYFRMDILYPTNAPYLRWDGRQFIDVTQKLFQELIHVVKPLIKHKKYTAFYAIKPIKLSININEVILEKLVKNLEKQNAPLAYLICGLLLDGLIENLRPDRPINKQAYLEKRRHDACTLYTKASKNKRLERFTDLLLWQQKTEGCASIINHLQQYDITPPKKLFPTCRFFKRDCVKIPLYRINFTKSEKLRLILRLEDKRSSSVEPAPQTDNKNLSLSYCAPIDEDEDEEKIRCCNIM